MQEFPRVVFVDVDDTLVRSFGSKRMPMSSVIDRVRELHRAGSEMYLWSSGGAEYARRSAEELNITDCFSGFLPKPTVMIDDQHPSEWTMMTWLHPNEASSRAATDY